VQIEVTQNASFERFIFIGHSRGVFIAEQFEDPMLGRGG
jgi:hypothetical protein